MQRRIADIKKDISAHSARSAWDKGVKGYAVELFDDYLDRLHITDDSVRIGKVAEADLAERRSELGAVQLRRLRGGLRW